jgi:hypothetical protein
MNLDSKEAVKLAKDWLAGQMSEEGIADIGLEEVRWNNGEWEITLGFSRKWDQTFAALAGIGGASRPRTYRVITVSDAEKRVSAMRIREAA